MLLLMACSDYSHVPRASPSEREKLAPAIICPEVPRIMTGTDSYNFAALYGLLRFHGEPGNSLDRKNRSELLL